MPWICFMAQLTGNQWVHQKTLPRSSVPEEVLPHPEIVYFLSCGISYACKNMLLTTSLASIHVLGCEVTTLPLRYHPAASLGVFSWCCWSTGMQGRWTNRYFKEVSVGNFNGEIKYWYLCFVPLCQKRLFFNPPARGHSKRILYHVHFQRQCKEQILPNSHQLPSLRVANLLQKRALCTAVAYKERIYLDVLVQAEVKGSDQPAKALVSLVQASVL